MTSPPNKKYIFILNLVSAAAHESEAEDVDKMEDASVIPDRPCLVLCMNKSFSWTRLKPL